MEKPLTEYYRNRRVCKSCHASNGREWAKNNREARLNHKRKHYHNNVEKLRKEALEYYHENRECIKERRRQYYENNRQQLREKSKQQYKLNPDKAKARMHRRRISAKNAKGSFTAEQWSMRLEFHENRCYYCGTQENLEIEHRIPLSRGGTNWPSNLVPACKSCNCKKGTQTEKEYYH